MNCSWEKLAIGRVGVINVDVVGSGRTFMTCERPVSTGYSCTVRQNSTLSVNNSPVTPSLPWLTL
jgi:hypothetical protein